VQALRNAIMMRVHCQSTPANRTEIHDRRTCLRSNAFKRLQPSANAFFAVTVQKIKTQLTAILPRDSPQRFFAAQALSFLEN